MKEVIMVESDQSLKSLCKLKDSVLEYQVTYIKEEPVSCGGGHLGETNIFVPQYHTEQYPLTHMKEEQPYSYEDGNLIYSSKCTSTGPIQHYTSTYVKKEPAFCDEDVINQVNYQPKDHIQCMSTSINEERVSCDRENITGANTYMLSGHTPLPSSTRVKKDSDSFETGQFTCPYTNIFADHVQQYPVTHIKEEPEPSDGGNSTKTNIYSLVHCTPYLSANIKEEPHSHEEEQLSVPNTYTQTNPTPHPSPSIKEEPNSFNQEDLIDLIICTKTDQTVHHLSVDVKGEPVSCDITIKHPEICTPSDDIHYPSPHLREESVSQDGRHLKDMKNNTPTDHIQKNPSSFDDEKTDLFDEADFTDYNNAKEQTAVNVPYQLVNKGDGLQEKNVHFNLCTNQQTAQSTDFTFKCLECEACFASKLNFEEHLTLHRGKKNHVCSHCGKCFSYQSQLLIHERTHTGEKPFTCSECGKCFNQYVHLAIHLMSHTGEKPYVCSECGKSFNRKTTLTIHQRVHTGEKPFHCSQCGKYFSTSSNLIKHQRVHTGEKPYSCSECGELFVHYTQLIRHQANHTSGKKFSCVECGKSFSQKAQFLRHERFHKSDNTYSCSECNQFFKHYKDFLVHQPTHTGQNPFTCRECGKHFTKKWTLVSHQRVHSGEKPFSCLECDKSFGLSSTLAKHKQVHVKKLVKSFPEREELFDCKTQIERQ
ncbi:uncharacterized protein ACNLHF_018593 isoform 1-T1 [Anomaloglossus baeobatrachus]|uniref:uncharacterized protein LOC142311214 n=1 Tax=Anomaloglossus baeobatrachus TaxID=238106 RepID=UPI003F501281